MSLSCVSSRALLGLTSPPVTVEVHLANGLPSFTLVGLADTEVREARERVRSAMQNAGLGFPNNQRITVNLAPADLPKDTGRFDLPIAVGILAANGLIPPAAIAHHVFAGELSLSGELRPVRGALAMAVALQQEDHPITLVLPPDSAEEAALVSGVRVVRAHHLLDVVQALNPDFASDTPSQWQVLAAQTHSTEPHYPDLNDVKGNASGRRALEIAAAGQHSLLMLGPPGCGKSMLAQRLPGLLPPLTPQEALESAAIASTAGRFKPEDWGKRCLRAPHHSASAVALVGGGSPPRPGEISLATNNVLFLDELPEFPRSALEALREPLETGHIHISRAAYQTVFPAQFQLVAAMNPCPCGYLGSKVRACRCTPDQISRYQGKISGPLLDRIDLHIEIPATTPQDILNAPAGESTAQVSERVLKARERAIQRQNTPNARLQGKALENALQLDLATTQFLQTAATKLGWSARTMHRILRVARTIADLAASNQVQISHVAEAIQLRRALFTTQQ